MRSCNANRSAAGSARSSARRPRPVGPTTWRRCCRWDRRRVGSARPVAAGVRRLVDGRGGSSTTRPDLAVERNVFRYRPLPGGVAVRFGTDATDRQRALVDRGRRTRHRVPTGRQRRRCRIGGRGSASRLAGLGDRSRFRMIGADARTRSSSSPLTMQRSASTTPGPWVLRRSSCPGGFASSRCRSRCTVTVGSIGMYPPALASCTVRRSLARGAPGTDDVRDG